MKHRGPDASGTFEGRHGESACGMAHARLAIIDLSPAGRQPMTSADGRYTIVFNGEIYNYRDVRADLESSGSSLRSGSDTEVILEAFSRWGASALERLRGMFAFAIWDAASGRLFMARDRMGVKPLLYTAGPHGFLFASELRTLLDTGLVDRRLDPEALSDYLAFGSVREPRTIVSDVAMLSAGSYAEWDGRGLRVTPYWRLPLSIDASISESLAVEQTQELLREAVKLRLVADVPVGVFLSGGMDSSAVVALAARASESKVHAFTVTFDEAAFDELPFAEEVSRKFGVEHRRVHLSSQRALEHIDEAIAALDQPSADGPNTYFVAQATREAGLSVALSGVGGDEIFAGYPSFRRFASMMRHRRLLSTVPRLRSSLAGRLAVVPAGVRKVVALLESDRTPFDVYAVQRAMFLPRERSALLDQRACAMPSPTKLDLEISQWAASPAGDALEAYGLFDLSNYLRNTLLRDADVMGMAHALEIREPLLDHRLVERLMTLPGRLKLAPGINKPLLARAVPELPKEASTRPKMGFTLPLETWLRGPLRRWAEERLLGSRGPAVLFSMPALAALWTDFMRGPRYTSVSRVWTVLALLEWCRAARVSL